MPSILPHSGIDVSNVPVNFAHNPGANTQATATVAAPGVGRRNVLKSLIVKIVSDGTAPTAAEGSLNIIGGASGGTAVWSIPIAIQAVAGQDNGFVLDGLSVPVALNTALTVEFSGALGGHIFEGVSGTVEVQNG
jgi:hypothetical protein